MIFSILHWIYSRQAIQLSGSLDIVILEITASSVLIDIHSTLNCGGSFTGRQYPVARILICIRYVSNKDINPVGPCDHTTTICPAWVVSNHAGTRTSAVWLDNGDTAARREYFILPYSLVSCNIPVYLMTKMLHSDMVMILKKIFYLFPKILLSSFHIYFMHEILLLLL